MILRLLIVDDDLSLCNNLRSFFERHKYKVETVNDGLSAIGVVEKFRPNLMFLDIGLPGISGIEVLKQVKEKDPAIRVIMITGQTEDELMRQARVLGADDYVTKPFTLEYLSGEVLDKLHKQLFYELRSTSTDLAIEHEKVEVLFDHVTDGVIMFDGQGMIFVANPVARNLLGLTGDVGIINAPKAFEAFKSIDGKALPFDKLEKLAGTPFEVMREEPKKLYINCRINPIHSRSKKDLFGYLAIMRDVTQERRAENAMHRFISMISHKLRTPLVAIRGYPPLLLSPNSTRPLDDFQRGAVETILRECLRLESLVNELIAFSSLEPEELTCQPVKVGDLIREAQKILSDEVKKQSDKIVIHPDLENLRVNVDPTLLQHAFRNLIENAFKFGAKELKVKARKETGSGKQGQNGNGWVVLELSDNGPGIPSEERERIFERFYQVDKDFVGQIPGAGLGLTAVKGMIEAHGGKVWVESAVGKGSTFLVKLPAVKS